MSTESKLSAAAVYDRKTENAIYCMLQEACPIHTQVKSKLYMMADGLKISYSLLKE